VNEHGRENQRLEGSDVRGKIDRAAPWRQCHDFKNTLNYGRTSTCARAYVDEAEHVDVTRQRTRPDGRPGRRAEQARGGAIDRAAPWRRSDGFQNLGARQRARVRALTRLSTLTSA
jgi:hypothetical protein